MTSKIKLTLDEPFSNQAYLTNAFFSCQPEFAGMIKINVFNLFDNKSFSIARDAFKTEHSNGYTIIYYS